MTVALTPATKVVTPKPAIVKVTVKDVLNRVRENLTKLQHTITLGAHSETVQGHVADITNDLSKVEAAAGKTEIKPEDIQLLDEIGTLSESTTPTIYQHLSANTDEVCEILEAHKYKGSDEWLYDTATRQFRDGAGVYVTEDEAIKAAAEFIVKAKLEPVVYNSGMDIPPAEHSDVIKANMARKEIATGSVPVVVPEPKPLPPAERPPVDAPAITPAAKEIVK